MPTIGLAIHHVVHEVHDARQRAEDDEAGGRARDGIDVEQLDRENERGEYEEVLGPLSRPERDKEAQEDRAAARCARPVAGRSIGSLHLG